MIELVIGALLIVGTLSWSRHETSAARRAGAGATEAEDTRSTARRVVPGLLLVLGVTLVVSGATGT